MSKGDLERLIDGCEKAKHAVLEAKQTEWKRHHKAQGKGDPAALYTASAAIKVQDFPWVHAIPMVLARQAHAFWLTVGDPITGVAAQRC